MSRGNKQQMSLCADVANILETFGLDTVRNCARLRRWQTVSGEIAPYQQQWLEEVRRDLEQWWDLWNEEELKMHFISSVFRAAQIDVPKKIATFYERPLRGTLLNQEFVVVCDCMVATPTKGNRPDKPYFFFQEFKRSKGDKLDPEAQMLLAMLLAQAKNNEARPLYGAWVQGKFWHFAVLDFPSSFLFLSSSSPSPPSFLSILLLLLRFTDLILYEQEEVARS